MVETPPILRLIPKLFSARTFVPDVKVPDFRQIDFHALRRAGYRGVVVDKDNCLTRPYNDTLVPHLRPAWEECKAAFGPGRVLIVSNSSGTRSDPTGLGAEALHRETGVPVLIHARKKPLCARDIDAYFGALPPALPLPPLTPAAEAAAAAAPNRHGVLSAVGNVLGVDQGGKRSAGESRAATERELGLVVIGDRLMTDVVLTGLLAGPREGPPVVVAAGLTPTPAAPPSAAPAPALPPPSSAASLTPVAAVNTPAIGIVQRQAPYNLSLLTTTLHQKADVRPLRLIERMLESLARRRLGRPLATDIAAWRSLGVIRPEPEPLAPAPLQGWRKGLSLAGRGLGWSVGELAKGLKISALWLGAKARQAWADRQARQAVEAERAAEEREVKQKAEVALDRLVKEDVERAHEFRVAADSEADARRAEPRTAPVMPQKEVEIAAVKA